MMAALLIHGILHGLVAVGKVALEIVLSPLGAFSGQ